MAATTFKKCFGFQRSIGRLGIDRPGLGIILFSDRILVEAQVKDAPQIAVLLSQRYLILQSPAQTGRLLKKCPGGAEIDGILHHHTKVRQRGSLLFCHAEIGKDANTLF